MRLVMACPSPPPLSTHVRAFASRAAADSTPEQLSTSLRRARLVPRGALLVLPEAARGVVRQASFGDWRAARANLAQAQAAMGPEDDTMQQAMQRMLEQMAVGGDGLPPAVGGGAPNMDYEALLQWEEQMGGAVAHGLTLTELAALPTRTLTTADVPALDPAAAGSAGEQPDPEGELGRCCICCCEFVSGDRLMSLPCTHAFHVRARHPHDRPRAPPRAAAPRPRFEGGGRLAFELRPCPCVHRLRACALAHMLLCLQLRPCPCVRPCLHAPVLAYAVCLQCALTCVRRLAVWAQAECIAPWLRAKRTCPLCKQCAVAGGDAEPSY
jgi:hypothetical protein